MSEDKLILPLTLQGNGQPNSQTCWYGSYKMMYLWNKKSVAELNQNIAKANFTPEEGDPDISQRGLRVNEYMQAAAALGLVGIPRTYAQKWTMGDVFERLRRWGPIFCAIYGNDGGGHAVVLYGADAKLGILTYADPYTLGDAANAHNDYFTLQAFKDAIQPFPFSLQVF